MKRWVFRRYGNAEVLEQEELSDFRPKPGRLGIRVGAISINPIDWKLMSGRMRLIAPVRFPSVPCFDVAGIVEDSNGLSDFRNGDHVFLKLNNRSGGAACTYVEADPRVTAKVPGGLSTEQAASIPLAGLTALQGMRDYGRLPLENSDRSVLIVGASGGVGHFAVQIAAAAGAYVTAVAGTRNVDMVKSLGADEVIDYRQQNTFEPRGDRPYDLVFDCVGETPLRFRDRFAPVLSKEGIYLTPVPSSDSLLRLLQFWRKPRTRVFLMKPSQLDLNYLSRLYQQGKLRPVIDSTFSFDQLPDAFRRSMSGRASGKIVVRVRGSG